MRTLAAGARRDAPFSSGYVRSVGIIGNEELFPNEGFAFPRASSKLTNSFRVSSDSPFSTSLDVPVVHRSEEQKVIENALQTACTNELMCTKAAARAIAAQTDGELRPFREQIVKQAVLKGRKSQLLLNEQLRFARMRDEDEWATIEQKRAEKSKEILGRETEAKKAAERELVRVYDRELTLHKKAQQREAKMDRRIVKKMIIQQKKDDEKEKQIQEAKRADLRAKIADSLEGNNSLLERKHEQLRLEEKEAKRIRKQYEALEKKRAERQELEIQARKEKDQRRERLIEIQSRQLAEAKARENKRTEVAVSDLEARYVLEKQKEDEKRKAMRAQQNREWLESLRMREEKILAEAEARTAPVGRFGDSNEEERLANEAVRRKRNERLRLDQELQAEERRRREEEERCGRRSRSERIYFLKD
jgi:hypothetical protein